MDWSFRSLYDALGSRIEDVLQSLRRETSETGLGPLITPVDPFNRSKLFTPVVTAAGIVSTVMLSGVALGALIVAMAALLALYYVLTEIFGYEFTLTVPAGFQV